MAEEALAPLDLNGSERILDVGCGNGNYHGDYHSRDNG
jgi:cyclopropane fatty-acyl-phospholipid synthase-like methyltransferase